MNDEQVQRFLQQMAEQNAANTSTAPSTVIEQPPKEAEPEEVMILKDGKVTRTKMDLKHYQEKHAMHKQAP